MIRGSDARVHPVLFTLGDVTIYSYGVATLASWVIAGALLLRAADTLKVPPNTAIQLGLFMLGGGILGGRLGFLIINRGASLRELISFGGGSIFFTAVLGGLIALALGARWLQRPVWTVLDLITPAIVGAWAIGNAGCFLAGCCVGNPTSGPFGMIFSADQTPLELRGVHVHPVQLYALMLEGAVVALWFIWSQAAPGARFLSAVASLLLMKVALASTGIAGGSSVVVV